MRAIVLALLIAVSAIAWPSSLAWHDAAPTAAPAGLMRRQGCSSGNIIGGALQPAKGCGSAEENSSLDRSILSSYSAMGLPLSLASTGADGAFSTNGAVFGGGGGGDDEGGSSSARSGTAATSTTAAQASDSSHSTPSAATTSTSQTQTGSSGGGAADSAAGTTGSVLLASSLAVVAVLALLS